MLRALIIGTAALAGVGVAVSTVAAQDGPSRREEVIVLRAPRPPAPPAPPAPPMPPRTGLAPRPPMPPLPPAPPEMAAVDAELRAARERLNEAARAYADAVRARGGAHAAADGRVMIHEMDGDRRVIVLGGEGLPPGEIERIRREAMGHTELAREHARHIRVITRDLHLNRGQIDETVRSAMAEAQAARAAAEAARREIEALRPEIERARREAERATR